MIQNTTKPCTYSMGYTLYNMHHQARRVSGDILYWCHWRDLNEDSPQRQPCHWGLIHWRLQGLSSLLLSSLQVLNNHIGWELQINPWITGSLLSSLRLLWLLLLLSLLFTNVILVSYVVHFISGVLCQEQVSRAGTSSYIAQYLWDVITCPCPW